MLYKPWLGREQRSMMNIKTNSWTWYRAWTNTLFHPNEDTWNTLLSEGNVSLGRAYVWITFTSLLFPLAYTVVAWIKFPHSINSSNILIFVTNIILIGVFEPIGFVVLTGVVHFLVKLFSKTGDYSSLFITSATSYVPISILRSLAATIRWLLAFKIGLYTGTILGVYFLAFVLPMIVKFNYQISLFKAFFVSVGVAILAYYAVIVLYATIGLGI